MEVGELIRMVEEVYRDYPHDRVNKIYLTLMTVMNEIVKSNGDNNYKIPHLGKDALASRPPYFRCTPLNSVQEPNLRFWVNRK